MTTTQQQRAEATDVPVRRGPMFSNLLPWGLVLLAGLVWFLRAPDALLHPQFWAEDAVIFHQQAMSDGFASLTQPALGYLHQVPRIIALFSTFFPSRFAPAIFCWGAYAAAFFTAILVMRLRLRERPLLGALAMLGFSLVSHLSHEVYWSLANIQWTMAAFLIALLMAEEACGLMETCLQAGFASLAGLTSPLSAALLPVLCVRLWSMRKTRLALPLAVACGGGLLQLCVIFSGHAQSSGAIFSKPLFLLEVLGRRVFLQGFVPAPLWELLNPLAVWLGVIGVLCLLISPCWLKARWLHGCLLLGALALMYYASVSRMDGKFDEWLLDPGNHGPADRYFLPIRFGVLLLLLLLVVEGPRVPRLGALVLLCMVPLASLGSFRAPALKDHHWERFAPQVDARQPVDIPVNPDWIYHYRPAPAP